MTKFRLCALLIAVLAVQCACTCHAQKSTVDPNSSRASKPAEDDVADPRLSQKVTYEAWHAPLKTIIEDLSTSTGVKLFAGYNKKDWQVRDRRMNVCVKDITLAKLMSSIARVMKFKWSRDDKLAPPVYRLVVDRRLVAALQAEASRLDRALKEEEKKRRTGLVDALAKVADLSGPELQTLRETNPYLYMCSQTGFAKAVTQMMADEPALRDAFVDANRSARVNAGLFTPATQQMCVDNVRKMWPLDHITQLRKPLNDSFADEFGACHVVFDCVRSPREYTQSKRLFYFGSVCSFPSDDFHFLGDMRDPYAKATRAWANACMDAVDRNEEPGAGWSTVAPKYFPTEEEEAKEVEPYLMFDPVVEHPDDPDLHKEVILKMSDEERKALMDEIMASGGRSYQRVQYQASLKALAKASGMNIVSDSYAVLLVRDTRAIPDKAELIAILDKLGDAYRLNWEKHSSTIELRRRDWFRRRASQLPDEWLDPWRKELEKNRAPSLDTYTHMVALEDDQVEENINSDPLLDQVVGGRGGDNSNRLFCRFYTQLSDSQREMTLSGTGLDLRSLSPTQRQCYANTFLYGWQDNWRTEDFVEPPEGAVVTITGDTKPGNDGSASYTFTARLMKEGSSDREQRWVIPLRKIQRPRDLPGKPQGKG